MKRYLLKSLIITFCFIVCSCNENKNEVVVYNTVDHIFSEPVLQDFERETGIRVKAVFDTEETKSTGILNRLIAEKQNPQCDVFWSGDPIRTAVLKKKGILEKHIPVNAKSIPDDFKDPDGYWTGFSVRSRVLIYNKELMPDSLVPQSIFDLTDSTYYEQVAFANPLFGTTTFHIAALFEQLGNTEMKLFLDDLKSNGAIIASSNGDVRRKVSRGEIWCGLTDTDDAFNAILAGEPVDIVFLDQGNFGTLIMPNTLSLVKNSPNAANGKKLIEYLLTKETESKLAKSCAQIPLISGAKTPPYLPSIEDFTAMKIDYSETSNKLESLQPYLQNLVENW